MQDKAVGVCRCFCTACRTKQGRNKSVHPMPCNRVWNTQSQARQNNTSLLPPTRALLPEVLAWWMSLPRDVSGVRAGVLLGRDPSPRSPSPAARVLSYPPSACSRAAAAAAAPPVVALAAAPAAAAPRAGCCRLLGAAAAAAALPLLLLACATFCQRRSCTAALSENLYVASG